jgi:hypothetical protein
VKSPVLRFGLWYGYMGALLCALLSAGVKFTWGRNDVLLAAIPVLFLSAWHALMTSPPRFVDAERRPHAVDHIGAGGVALAITAFQMDSVMRDLTDGARFTIMGSMLCIGIVGTITCAILRARLPQEVADELFSELRGPKIL